MKLQELFFANAQLKLLSLLLAAVLWLFVTLETGDEAEVPLMVKFVNIPPGLTLQRAPTLPLSLRVAGSRTLLIRQKWLGVRVELDLSKGQAGQVTFSGLDRHVTLIPGVRPLSVSPASLDIFLARQKQ
jgi:hypothetical protein